MSTDIIMGDARRVFDALSEHRRAELRAGDAGPWAVSVGIYEVRRVSPHFGVTVLTALGDAVLSLCLSVKGEPDTDDPEAL